MKFKLVLGLALMLGTSPVWAAKAKEPVTVTSAKAFKDVQSIVVAGFTIGFLTSKTDQAFAGSRGYGGSSMAKTQLAGMTPADFQAITDAAYADFTVKMAAAGYTVVDHGRFTADPAVAKVKFVASGHESTMVFGKDSKAKAQFYGPTAFGAAPILDGENGNGMFAGFGAMGPAMAKARYAVNNKQPIITVAYIVDYASADHYGGYFALSSSVKVKAQLAMAETLSKVTVINGTGLTGSIALKDAIAVGGEFGDLQDSTTTGQRIDQALGNVIGILGGVGTSSRKFFTFTATPDQYKLGAIDAASRANDMMVARLQALR